MKKTIACAALLAAAFAARAELERISLNGTWDFSFARDAKLSSASSDFKATDKMVVPGCFDLMPKWYAQRGLAHYRRTFALDKQTKDAWLVVKGMGLQAKFFIDGREVAVSKLPYSTLEIPLGSLAAGEHTLVIALDNRLSGSKDLVFKGFYDFFLSGGFYHGVELKLQHAEVELDRVVVRTRDYKTGTVELALEAKGALPASLDATVSFDGGAAKAVRFADGRAMRHPRAANFTWRCENGKYLYWFHNHGGTWYDDRNPVWICGGTEADGPEGKILVWSQPEILLYDDDPWIRISYPDLIEDGGAYYITETQKDAARVHEIDPSLLEGLWSQATLSRPAAEGLLLDLESPRGAFPVPPLPEFSVRDPAAPDGRGLRTRAGVTLTLDYSGGLPSGVRLFSTMEEDGRGVLVETETGSRLRFSCGVKNWNL